MIKKTSLFIGILLLTTACSNRHATADNTDLEKPPRLEIKVMPKAAVIEADVDNGLGDAVSLIDAKRISLKQPFEQAWNTVETVLQFNQIEITDRNREKGEFFINYDPDNARRKNNDVIGDVAFFLFKDEYTEAPYKIIITESEQTVEITAHKREYIQLDLLDDGEELEFDDEVDDGADKLIRHLYVTLKNDLPLD